MASGGAFAFLKQHRQLPTLERSSSSPLSSSSAAAWGRGARQWSSKPPSATAADEAENEAGDEMPRELRTLVGASFDVFMRLARLAEEAQRSGRALAPLEVVRASRQYREALRTCVFAIEDRVELQQRSLRAATTTTTPTTTEAQEAVEEDEEFVDLLKVSLAIWHLCELLFLQRRPRDDSALAYDLARWLQEHFASARMEQLEAASTALQHASAPEQDPAYWSTLHALAMVGSGSGAWRLLAAHSKYRALASRDVASRTSASTRAMFESFQRLLLAMPGSARQPGEWAAWHDACQHVLRTDAAVKADAGLAMLLRILVADDDALARQASCWYELMIARLVLEAPKRVAHRFEFLMASCFRTYNADAGAMGNFECIILAVLQYDVQSALQDVHALGFSWMAAHLGDLLAKSGAVAAADELAEPLGVSLHEFFLLHYAMDVGASRGLWQFALGYYERCPRFGLVAARSALAREPVPTDSKANRLLAYCQGKRGLRAVQRTVAARRARLCQASRLYSAALVWLLRGGHLDDVDAVCEAVLHECRERKSLAPLHEATEFLEAHPEMAQTPLLEWLVRYREFFLVLDDCEALRQQVREAEYASDTESESGAQETVARKLRFVQQEAARRLHWLVGSSAAPRELRAVLLEEAEKLLRVQPTVYAPPSLYALHAYLHQLDRAFDRAAFYRSGANAQLKARVETLLARNLSEAILADASAGAACSLAAAATSGGPSALPLLTAPAYGSLGGSRAFTPMDEDM
ncbi:hypothetical protein PybrP1_005539 [[Pythium] brassicae (nom. inval.)]|nr:hypothetical protein PybrP1_005539 [[Pythium] brassicae (nom. inval.)]